MHLTLEEFDAVFDNLAKESWHLEARDSYGTERELPHFAAWLAGQDDDLGWLEGWCRTVRHQTAQGKQFKRVFVASEPLSDYRRWTYDVVTPIVEAGEDIRWVPRRAVSSIAFPGNDFYVIDGEYVIFMHYSGEGLIQDIITSTDPSDLALCRAAFESVWELATPHKDAKHP
jgi:hypothetical protein